GNLAASTEAVEQCAFAAGSGMGSGVVQKFQLLASGAIAFANFNAEGTLAGGGAHDFGGDDLFDEFRFAEALQSGDSQDNCIVFSLLEFAQAGVDVAAQRMNPEVGADRFELCLAAQAGRAEARSLGQIPKAGVMTRAESVARIFPLCDSGDFESRRKIGGQILQRVDGEIDAASGESLFDFLGENSFAEPTLRTDHGQGDVGDLIATGVDDFDFDFVAAGAQERGDVIGLPKSELRAAGADAEFSGALGGGVHLGRFRGRGGSGISMT